MPEIVLIRLRPPVVTCFLGQEARNYNCLVWIRFWLARERSVRDRSGNRAAGGVHPGRQVCATT